MPTVHRVTSCRTFQRQRHCSFVCGLETSQTLTEHHQSGGIDPCGSCVWKSVSLSRHEALDSSGSRERIYCKCIFFKGFVMKMHINNISSVVFT